jgi:hypothetical protein
MLNKTYLPKLKEQGYEVVLTKWEHVVMHDGKEHIKLFYEFPDREVTDVVFPSSLDYVISNLRRKLNLEDQALNVSEILDAATGAKLNVWVVYNKANNQTYRNIQLHQPAPTVEDADVESVEV